MAHPQQDQSKKSAVENSNKKRHLPTAFSLHHTMSSTASVMSNSSSSPMKRARKRLARHRSLLSLSQERIASWLRRFDRFRKESAANGSLGVICEKIRDAAHGVYERWAMAAVSPAEIVIDRARMPDLFIHRHRALHKVTDRVVELALAPVFFFCIALDHVSRPMAIPTTSVFSACVITFVLKVLTIATELRQKYLPLKTGSAE